MSFTICTNDGYLVDMIGSYPTNQNDADILKTIIEDPNRLCKLLRRNGGFVLDRGFRDVAKDLDEQFFKVMMPALKRKRKQLLTEESNESGFATYIRWAVEAVRCVLKQNYRLLDSKIDSKLVPKVGIYFRVISFLNNTYGQRLQSEAEFSNEILQRKHAQKDVENILTTETEEKLWMFQK